jgi:deoxyribonucleoside regulator
MMNKYETLVQVAKWYYLDGLGQAEIARKIKKSRSMVSKMITEARTQNIVDIRINFPTSRNRDLELVLKNHLQLDSVWVVESAGSLELNHLALVSTGAQCLGTFLTPGMTLGMAWSRTLRDVIQQVEPAVQLGITVVQLSGSAAMGEASLDGIEIVRALSEKLGGTHRYFPAPLIVRTKELADALMHEPMVQASLRYAQKCDVAVIGIGAADPAENSLLQSKLLESKSLHDLISKGAVGDILAYQLREDGTPVDTDFNKRVIGLSADALLQIPRVIAIAAGKAKTKAIYAASKGAYISTLVTDSVTATELLGLRPINFNGETPRMQKFTSGATA